MHTVDEEAKKVKQSLKLLSRANRGKPALPKHGLAGYKGEKTAGFQPLATRLRI